jgi:hypothetical protein
MRPLRKMAMNEVFMLMILLFGLEVFGVDCL